MTKFFLLTAAVWLGACTTQMLFDKPGAAPGSGQGDLTDCEVEALSKVPPSNQTKTISGIPATTDTTCIAGSCTSTTYGGKSSVYTVDANANLRKRVVIQCMERKGYTLRG